MRRIRGTHTEPPKAEFTRTARPEEFREFLLAKRAELVSVLQNRPGVLAESGHVCEEDQPPLVNGEFIAVWVNQISHEQLELVKAALVRLDSGEYGICVECERPIGAKRLAAVPWASYCIDCQEQLDPIRDSLERPHP